MRNTSIPMTRSAVNIFLQQFQKILNGETGLLENATDEFLAEVAWMHRDGYRSFRMRVVQLRVTASLVNNFKTRPLKLAQNDMRRQLRHNAHNYARRTGVRTSLISPVRLARIRTSPSIETSIASFAIRFACARLVPKVTISGYLGMETR